MPGSVSRARVCCSCHAGLQVRDLGSSFGFRVWGLGFRVKDIGA